ncbi:hypothetical protein ACV7JQ_07010 [Globicatella sulfidifaciens]
MYKFDIINDETITTIHDINNEQVRIISDTFTEEIGKISSISFSLTNQNPGFSAIKPMKSRIVIYNIDSGSVFFSGRILTSKKEMNDNGEVIKNYTCEGPLGMLHDSEQEAFSYQGYVKELAERLLKRHNERVEPYKQFVLGKCDIGSYLTNKSVSVTGGRTQLEVGDSATIINSATTYYDYTGNSVAIPNFVKGRLHTVKEYDQSKDRYLLYYGEVPIAWVNSSDIYETEPQIEIGEDTKIEKVEVRTQLEVDIKDGMSTYDAFDKLIIQHLGGFMIWESVEGVNTLHLVKEYGEESKTAIELGINLMSISENFDPTKVITRLRPIGNLRKENE